MFTFVLVEITFGEGCRAPRVQQFMQKKNSAPLPVAVTCQNDAPHYHILEGNEPRHSDNVLAWQASPVIAARAF